MKRSHVKATLGLSAAVAGGLGVLVVLQPLAVYSLALGAFGLPHVVSEIRFIDRRFGQVLRGSFLTRVALTVLALLCVRTCGVLRWLPAEIEAPIELGGLGALALLALNGLATQSLLALAVGAALIAAAVFSPFDALVAVAILHNITPLGFFWSTAPRDQRFRVMSLATAGLVGLPLLIATGLPRRLLQPLSVGPLIDPLRAGPLDKNLFVYVPSSFLDGGHALDFFSASVMAQCAHYFSVIVFLPALLFGSAHSPKELIPWPTGFLFASLSAAIGAFGLLRFSANFVDARTLYGLLAAAHVWIEIPILILALSQGDHLLSQSPARKEAPLAISDTRAA